MSKKVLVFGVFDGIHDGHISFLREAGKLGDLLIAVVTRDEIVKKLKNRAPGKNADLRARELLNSGLVSQVVMGDSELDNWGVIRAHKPDVIALGYDQISLKSALSHFLKESGCGIEIKVMAPHKPGEMHSSLITK